MGDRPGNPTPSTKSIDQVPKRAESLQHPQGGQSMRSNSRNFLLSASASRSDDEQPQSAQPISSINAGQQQMAMPGHQQFGYAMGSNGNSVPLLGQGLPRTGQHLQPSLGDLYCQVQELEIRLRHLEIFVFANPNIMRTLPVAPTNIMNPQSSHDDLNFGPTNEGQAAENHHDKNIHRGDLDRVCLPVLERLSHPPSTTLNDIARQLEVQFPNMFRQELLSVIRRWFRKRREEMSQRIFNATRKILTGRDYTKEELQQMAETLEANDNMVQRVKREANLEIADETEALSFCHQKVVSYLRRAADEAPSSVI